MTGPESEEGLAQLSLHLHPRSKGLACCVAPRHYFALCNTTNLISYGTNTNNAHVESGPRLPSCADSDDVEWTLAKYRYHSTSDAALQDNRRNALLTVTHEVNLPINAIECRGHA